MTPWDHIEIGIGYVESELENIDNDNLFNYGGQNYSLAYNRLWKSKKNLHYYYGLNIQYTSLSNNADNNVMSEKASHLAPGIHFKTYINNLFLNVGYNFTMAEHEGSGLRTTNLDFDIHKLNLKVGYDYPLTNNLYLMGSYNFGYGITGGLDDEHIYIDHVFSLNLVIKVGDNPEDNVGSGSSSGKGSSTSRRNFESIKVDKRNNLYDFFIITD